MNEIISIINVIKRNDQESKYPQYTNSKSYVTNLKTNNGHFRVWCNDFSADSNVGEKWRNSLAIAINSKVFSDYVEEAYK